MRYGFLVETFRTEREKTLSVWAMFADADLRTRPHATDERGRSLLDHLVHQCVGEHGWFAKFLGLAGEAPLPADEQRLAFIATYARDSATRADQLAATDDAWWEGATSFFGESRSRAWVVTRRIAHTAHHRGQQTALLRVLGREVLSTYGPTADTGGLAADGGAVIYPYRDVASLLSGVARGEPARANGAPASRRPTER